MNTTSARAPRDECDPRPLAYHRGYVIETKSWNGESEFWRNGHGWMRTLRQATIFVKQNDAISKCVQLGSQRCTVMVANFSTGHAVYPPSRVNAEFND